MAAAVAGIDPVAVPEDRADGRGLMFPGADDGVDRDHGIAVESRDPNRDNQAIAMVRSRHIGTRIEPDPASSQGCMYIHSDSFNRLREVVHKLATLVYNEGKYDNRIRKSFPYVIACLRI